MINKIGRRASFIILGVMLIAFGLLILKVCGQIQADYEKAQSFNQTDFTVVKVNELERYTSTRTEKPEVQKEL